MSRNTDRKKTTTALLAEAILLETDKIKQEQRDRELRKKIEELAKTSLELYQRFDNLSQDQTDTPQLSRKWHELAHAIRRLSR
jgi:predicted RNase H-like nuclease (RuvC/YqgF family)